MAYDATDFTVDPTQLTTPRERLVYLRDFLLRLPAERFNMDFMGCPLDADRGECGSPACIGGWARAIFRYRSLNINDAGRELLGLGDSVHPLFWPTERKMADGTLAYNASPADAAAVLTHLLNTGEVDWSVARAAP